MKKYQHRMRLHKDDGFFGPWSGLTVAGMFENDNAAILHVIEKWPQEDRYEFEVMEGIRLVASWYGVSHAAVERMKNTQCGPANDMVGVSPMAAPSPIIAEMRKRFGRPDGNPDD